MKKYALSRSGAIDFIKASLACTPTNLCLMLPVGLLYYLVNDMLNKEIPQSHYLFYIVGIVVVIVLLFACYYLQYNLTFFTTYKESGIRRIQLAERLRKLPLSFFGKKDLTDLTSVILKDCEVLEHNFSHVMAQFVGSILSTIIIAIGLFMMNVKLAFASLWIFPISLFIVLFSGRFQNIFNKQKNDANLRCIDGIQECIESVKELKANHCEERYLNDLNEKIVDVEKKSLSSELMTAIFVCNSSLLLKLGIGTVAVVGSSLLLSHEIDLSMFIMFLIVVSRIYEPMSVSLVNLAAINAQKLNIERMNEFNDYHIQTGETTMHNQGYDIEFKNVDFAYRQGEKIIDNVSFVAKQGEVTALVGPSGSGKSTISKLCARFYDIDKGDITLGGESIKNIDPETLLDNYSIVFQDVNLFDNTILENIRVGKKDATDEEVLKVAKEAMCDEFVKELPQGYQTVIGENGAYLSGGQRQRISIARAMLKDSPIILLDEATASLDVESETQVQQALSKLIQNKTVLIIAHRMRTVNNADKIIVLKDGKVAEEGTPQDLLQENGIYKHMLELQSENI